MYIHSGKFLLSLLFIICGYDFLFSDYHIKQYNVQFMSISSVVYYIRCYRNSILLASKDEEELIECICFN